MHKRGQDDPHLGEINLISRRFTILGSVAANPRISRTRTKVRERTTWPEIRGTHSTIGINVANGSIARRNDRVVITNDVTI